MKKITTIIFVLVLTISNIGFSQELITNGDFETGVLSPWAGTSGVSISTDSPYEGLYRANMGNDYKQIDQAITPTIGIEYTVSFWYKIANAGVSASDKPFALIIDNVTSTNLAFEELDHTATNWTKHTFTFTSTVSDCKFRMYKLARQSGGINNAVWLDAVSIIPTSTLSVNNLSQFNFKTYPNPTTDYLHLSASKTIDKIEIYNALGTQVLKNEFDSNTPTVSVSNLPNGVYVLKAFISGSVGTHKFIKQ
jgi:hypothetical protein